MKKVNDVFAVHFEKFEGEIQEIDPKDLPKYCREILKGMVTLLKMIEQDPTYAAMAFYQQITFNDHQLMDQLVSSDSILTWEEIRPTLDFTDGAMEKTALLEAKGFQNALLIIAGLNFILWHKEIYQVVSDEESSGDLVGQQTAEQLHEEGDLPDEEDDPQIEENDEGADALGEEE